MRRSTTPPMVTSVRGKRFSRRCKNDLLVDGVFALRYSCKHFSVSAQSSTDAVVASMLQETPPAAAAALGRSSMSFRGRRGRDFPSCPK
jgi:hypothetical protein